VVIDDASQVPLSLEEKKCNLIRNEERAGVAASRHIGALHSTGDFLLLTDSHVRFEPGWYETLMERIKDRPTTMHNLLCVQLVPGMMDMAQSRGTYHGAYIHFYGPDQNDGGRMQTLEGKWAKERPGEDDYPLSCIMGAGYVMPTDFYFHVGGLRLLKGWGLDEPFLSLKWWLAGGDIRMLKSVRIGHQFRQSTTYKTDQWKVTFNKLALCHTCLPKERAAALIATLPNSEDLTIAKRQINAEWNTILSERAYNMSVFVRSFEWYLSHFGLSCP
jgi:glycosyltransferase involved in cell wall biosynthesis